MATEKQKAYWRKKRKEYRERHPDRVKASKAASFQRNKNTPKNLAKKAARRETENAQRRARYQKDPEKGRAAAKAYRDRHADKLAAEAREKRANRTPEEIERDREQRQAAYLADQENLKAKQRAYNRRKDNNPKWHREYLERNPDIYVKVLASSKAWGQRNKSYVAKRSKRHRRKLVERIPAPRKYQRWTPAEDAIIARRDITFVEKCFLTGRSYDAVASRHRTIKRRNEAA